MLNPCRDFMPPVKSLNVGGGANQSRIVSGRNPSFWPVTWIEALPFPQ